MVDCLKCYLIEVCMTALGAYVFIIKKSINGEELI